VDDAVTGELYEQVLAHGPRTLDDGPVEQLGGVGEAALGARDARRTALRTPVRRRAPSGGCGVPQARVPSLSGDSLGRGTESDVRSRPMAGQEPEQRLGRDGVSGLVSPSRAMRARDVSRPTQEDLAEAVKVAADVLRRRKRSVTQA
jgi:hypothetical protein